VKWLIEEQQQDFLKLSGVTEELTLSMRCQTLHKTDKTQHTISVKNCVGVYRTTFLTTSINIEVWQGTCDFN